jgi:hypothetical protein
VVSGIIAAHGVEGLFMCTMMAGVLLVIAGAAGMGSMVRFIPVREPDHDGPPTRWQMPSRAGARRARR